MKVYVEDGAYKPMKAHSTDAGFDLFSPDNFDLADSAPAIINTKVHIEIPEGYVGLILPKSGLNVKQSILSFGVIDSGYTGAIVVKLYKLSNEVYHINKGDKISQIIFVPISKVNELESVNSLDEFEDSDRGTDGFGSTGK